MIDYNVPTYIRWRGRQQTHIRPKDEDVATILAIRQLVRDATGQEPSNQDIYDEALARDLPRQYAVAKALKGDK